MFIKVFQQFWGFIRWTDDLYIRILVQLVLPSWILLRMDVRTSSLLKHQLAVFSILTPSGPCWFLLQIAHEFGHSGLVLWMDMIEWLHVDLPRMGFNDYGIDVWEVAIGLCVGLEDDWRVWLGRDGLCYFNDIAIYDRNRPDIVIHILLYPLDPVDLLQFTSILMNTHIILIGPTKGTLPA